MQQLGPSIPHNSSTMTRWTAAGRSQVIPRAMHKDGVAPQARCKSFTCVKSQAPGTIAYGAKRPFTEKLTSEKRQQEMLLGCREDALPANGAPGSQLTCADWRAQGLRQRR